MNLFTKQKQIHRHRKKIMITEGERGSGVKLGIWDQQKQITIYKTYKKAILPNSTGNHIQYLVINHNGKEYEQESIYVYS